MCCLCAPSGNDALKHVPCPASLGSYLGIVLHRCKKGRVGDRALHLEGVHALGPWTLSWVPLGPGCVWA